MNLYYESELYHHGIKGMKWGVRRFQNKDGSLTPRGKKRISKKYKKLAVDAMTELSGQSNDMWVRAYNKTAEKFNNGETDKFNKAWEKKHGSKSFESQAYEDSYTKMLDKNFEKEYNKELANFYRTSTSYKKAVDFAKKYDMTKWDDLAKENQDTVDELNRIVDKYK